MNKPTRSDLRTKDPEGLRSQSRSMRICLGICNSQYDPLGLARPIVSRSRLAMRLIHQAQLGWSDELPNDLKVQWWEPQEMIVVAGNLTPGDLTPRAPGTSLGDRGQ